MSTNQVVDQKTFGDKTVKVYYDDSPENPRENETPMGTIACFKHRRYDLGDEKLEDVDAYNEIVNNPDNVCIPLYFYDHGNVSMRAIRGRPTYPFNCEWDSAMCGVIYMTKAKVKEEYGDVSPESIEKACSYMESEVDRYSHYLNGSVYGYVIEDEAGEEIDSCWGYYEDTDSVIKCAAQENGLDEKAKPAKFDEKKRKKYVRNQGNDCPCCGATGTVVVKGKPEQEDNHAITQTVGCSKCDESWTEIYKLSSIRS